MASYNKFQVKKAEVEILTKLNERLADLEKDNLMSYEAVGKETEQATDWRTGELLWEDEEKTIPKYRDHYDYVEKTSLNDEEAAYQAAINTIRQALEKLL